MKLSSECSHDIVFYGIVNLRDKGEQVGTIDVWKCRACGDIFCEDKRWGLTELASDIGFPKLGKDEEWAVLGCREGKELTWKLLGVRPDSKLDHDCPNRVRLEVDSDLRLKGDASDRHRLVIVKDSIARSIEL